MAIDVFAKMSTLTHRLLPELQNAIDRVLSERSRDYWHTHVLANLRPEDKRFWEKDGVKSFKDLDLQGVVKVIESNFNDFRSQCGDHYSLRDLCAVKKMRNTYAHDNGSLPIQTALLHIPIIRKLSQWLQLPVNKLDLVERMRTELEGAENPPPYKIQVSPVSHPGKTIPSIEIVMTERCSTQLTKMPEGDKGNVTRAMASIFQRKDGPVLTKFGQRIYAAELPGGYAAILYNTPADEYISVSIEPVSTYREWINAHSVTYDSESGHMAITHVISEGGTKSEEATWTNDPVGTDQELPDHGGGAVTYDPVLAESRTVSEMLKKNPARRSGFKVLDDALYRKMLDGTLENWQVFLHPDQLRAVEMDAEGPMMVKGPAGTGKTVVVVHRAKWLLENKFTGNERILITTFNKSLEFAINEMLKCTCTQEQMRRLDVLYFDQWLQDAWKKMGGKKILYREEDIKSDDNLFRLKLTLFRLQGLVNVDRDDDFIEREYDTVIQEYGIRSEADYLKAVRPKKLGVLKQEERSRLWMLFQKINGDPFDENVQPHNISTRMRVINHVTKAILARKYGIAGEYAAVLVDESQDMGAAEYRLFGALTGNNSSQENANSLLFAGDGHQRIYGRMGSLISCGINVRGARTISLKKCYRSSRAIKRYAESILTGVRNVDMDDVEETFAGSDAIEEGIPPVECFGMGKDYNAFYKNIANTIKEWMSKGSKRLSDYAVLLREGSFANSKTWRLKKTVEGLKKSGLDAVAVHARDTYDNGNSVKVMTMHRAKGMQFHGVVIILDGWPHKPDKDADAEARKENLDDEKKLLYMAVMRALKFVCLTATKPKPAALCFKNSLQGTLSESEPTQKPSATNMSQPGSPQPKVVRPSNEKSKAYFEFRSWLTLNRKCSNEDLSKFETNAEELICAQRVQNKQAEIMSWFFVDKDKVLNPLWKEFFEGRVEFSLTDAVCAYMEDGKPTLPGSTEDNAIVPANPTPEPIIMKVQCPVCAAMVRSDRLQKHIRKVHGPGKHASKGNRLRNLKPPKDLEDVQREIYGDW